MNIEDSIRTDGLLCGLGIAAEAVTYAGRRVAAIIDRQLTSFPMMDAGYERSEPVNIEILKGSTTSTDTIDIDGVSVPLDLRGISPKNRDTVVIDNINRIVSEIDNSGTAWIITTIRAH